MPKWEWDKRLETGIDEIDDQHRELFNRIDKLELAMYSGKGAAELKQLVEFLLSYVDEHFGSEERVMLDAGYPVSRSMRISIMNSANFLMNS
jgi:hemerythrin